MFIVRVHENLRISTCVENYDHDYVETKNYVVGWHTNIIPKHHITAMSYKFIRVFEIWFYKAKD